METEISTNEEQLGEANDRGLGEDFIKPIKFWDLQCFVLVFFGLGFMLGLVAAGLIHLASLSKFVLTPTLAFIALGLICLLLSRMWYGAIVKASRKDPKHNG